MKNALKVLKNSLQVLAVVILSGQSLFGAETPIYRLKLEGDANGADSSFTNISTVSARTVVSYTSKVDVVQFVSGGTTSYLNQADVSSLQGTVPESELKMLFAKNPTNGALGSAVVPYGWLGDTTLGSEGFRHVGALGGYSLDEFVEGTATRGVSRALPVFSWVTSSRYITWSGGDVYDPTNGYYHLNPGSVTLVDNAVNYAYWEHSDPLLIKWTSGSRPSASTTIYLATFSVSLGQIMHARVTGSSGDSVVQGEAANADVMPSLIVQGMNVFPTGTDLTNIILNGGTEYYDMSERSDHPSFNFNTNQVLIMYGLTNGIWANIVTNLFPVGLWNNGTSIVACASDKYYRGVFVGMAAKGHLDWIIPTAEYVDLASASAGSDPVLPPGFDPYIPILTAYVFKGDDIALRTDTAYWLDRRFMIRRGTLNTGGGSGSTPTIQQVLIAGKGTGGLLMDGMGFPSENDQAASKGYVDSTINNINANRAYVDNYGDDLTAKLQSSILPFKTIQKAINAAASVATDKNRYSVMISPGNYIGNVSMSNYVSLIGSDISGTFIYGSITYPPAYTDVFGAEVALISVQSDNSPALIINSGSDEAYAGIRSGAFYSSYTNGMQNKSVILAERGIGELYATTYIELTVTNVPGGGTVGHAQTIEHTTDPSNVGLCQFTSYSSSAMIRSYDVNDILSMAYTHDNQDSGCINTLMGGMFNIHLDGIGIAYSNNIRLVNHERAIGRTLSMSNVTRLYMNTNNACNLFMAWSENGSGDNVAIIRNNHIRVVSGSSSNIWYGASMTTNDNVRIYDTEIVQKNAFNYYPRRYTVLGSAGGYYFTSAHQNGDMLLGGALDFGSINTATETLPETGHLKIYVYPYAGLEQPYYTDSSGNTFRITRDSVFNGYNGGSTPMPVGTPVYRMAGTSPEELTTVMGKCNASDASRMPCMGIVVQKGGIAPGVAGHVMYYGRTEVYLDTSMLQAGDPLYVSDVNDGMLTNVPPSSSHIRQHVGWVHTSSTNGLMSVHIWSPDMLGGKVPDAYVSDGYIGSVSITGTVSATSFKNTGDLYASTTNVFHGFNSFYMRPEVGGQFLCSYMSGTNPITPAGVAVGPGFNGKRSRGTFDAPLNVESNDVLLSLTGRGYGDTGYSDLSDGKITIVANEHFSDSNRGTRIDFKTTLKENSGIPVRATRVFIEDDGIHAYRGYRTIVGGYDPTEWITYDDVGKMISTISSQTLYGWTNSHPVIIGAGLLVPSNAVSPQSIVFPVAIGTNNVGVYAYGKPINQGLQAGSYNGKIFASKNGDSNAYVFSQLVAVTNGGERILATSYLSVPVDKNIIKAFDLNASIKENYFTDATNEYLGVHLYIVSEGVQNVSLYTGDGFPSSINSPSLDISTSLVLTFNGRGGVVTLASNDIVSAHGILMSDFISETNRAISSENDLQSQISSSTNRISILEYMTSVWNRAVSDVSGIQGSTSLWNTASSNSILSTNRLSLIEIRTSSWNQVVSDVSVLQGRTSVWDIAYSTSVNATNRIALIETRTSSWNQSISDLVSETNRALVSENTISNSLNITITNLNAQLIYETNRATVAETNIQIQINSATNRIKTIENRTNAWNLVSQSTKFLANIGTNITYLKSATILKIPFNNVILDTAGAYPNSPGVYSNLVSRWIPGISGAVVRISGALHFGVKANNDIFNVFVYKNGLQNSQIGADLIPNANGDFCKPFLYVDVTTNANDFYEIYMSTPSNVETSIGAGSDNWWCGQILY